jgi:ferric-dicitrate binding protein FerR (iron transport regulator)
MSDEESIERLLRDAGPRPALPDEDLRAIRDAAREEWARRYPAARSPRRATGWMAIAAALLLAASAAVLWRSRRAEPLATPPSVEVARVEKSTGGSRWPAGTTLTAGTRVETGPGERVALRTSDGVSVRLDADTRARLESATLVGLERGAVYIDTNAPETSRGEVTVRTASGLFRPMGTRFEVRVDAATARVRVREGAVEIDPGREPVRAAAGEEVTVRGGEIERRAVAVYGPDWDWVLEAAVTPEIEGMKVRDFLDWIARETGRNVELSSAEARALADSVSLHGSVANLEPLEATAVVLSSAGLEHRLSDGTLVVSVSKKARP